MTKRLKDVDEVGCVDGPLSKKETSPSKTQYIISTSGRESSKRRYGSLLGGLNLDIKYVPITPSRDDGKIHPSDFVAALREVNYIGGAISKDIKGTIIDHIDGVDEFAANIGAVNTVVKEGGKLIGYNTDAIGFELSIKNGIEGKGIERAVVYGYGGVTSVVVSVLKKLGIQVTVTGRRPEEATKRAEALDIEVFSATFHPQLFINAAPIGDQDLCDVIGFTDALEGCIVVFDHEMPGTKLKKHCVDEGIHHIPGTDMYYPQMAAQWKLFLKDVLSDDADLEALLISIEAHVNKSD